MVVFIKSIRSALEHFRIHTEPSHAFYSCCGFILEICSRTSLLGSKKKCALFNVEYLKN